MNNIIFTRVSVFRNLKDYKFVPKLDKEKAQLIENELDKILNKNFHKVIVQNTDNSTLKYLYENDLISKNTKGVYLDKQNMLSVSLFEGEHINIRSNSIGFNKNSIQNALNLVNLLSTKINLAYNDEYGYLMSDLSKIGSGIKLECDLDLNSIVSIEKIEQVKHNVRNLGFNLKEKENTVFTLSTMCNLGFSESEIISEFEKMATKLQDLEMESAKMLLASKHDEVMDKVMRAEAILKSAYLMNVNELKTLLSILRTGLNLSIVKISEEQLTKLQQLAMSKNSAIATQSELIELADNIKNIFKGENNV